MTVTARTLFSSPLVRLAEFICRTPRSGPGRERCDATPSLTIIRRGVHAHHARGRVALAEPGLALLYRGGEPYRLSHPYDRAEPDRSTCIELAPDLLEEAFGAERRPEDLGVQLRPATQMLDLQVGSALARSGCDRLAAEERVLALVRAVAGDLAAAPPDHAAVASARRRVERARAVIAAAPAADHRLADVAAAAACSPFHLARLFKRQTGMTIRGYRLRLRLALALHELADGATDLTALALRAGFADHSHMTASFRKVFGRTPSALREALRGRALDQESKFLQAAARHRT